MVAFCPEFTLEVTDSSLHEPKPLILVLSMHIEDGNDKHYFRAKCAIGGMAASVAPSMQSIVDDRLHNLHEPMWRVTQKLGRKHRF